MNDVRGTENPISYGILDLIAEDALAATPEELLAEAAKDGEDLDALANVFAQAEKRAVLEWEASKAKARTPWANYAWKGLTTSLGGYLGSSPTPLISKWRVVGSAAALGLLASILVGERMREASTNMARSAAPTMRVAEQYHGAEDFAQAVRLYRRAERDIDAYTESRFGGLFPVAPQSEPDGSTLAQLLKRSAKQGEVTDTAEAVDTQNSLDGPSTAAHQDRLKLLAESARREIAKERGHKNSALAHKSAPPPGYAGIQNNLHD